MTAKPTLILHIGHYKTGTTALQVFLAQNEQLLARQGIRYAQTARKNAKHSALAFTQLIEAGAQDMMYDFEVDQSAVTLWAGIADETRAAGPKGAVIVSSEEFIRFGAHPRAGQALRALADQWRDIDVRVVAFLRAPHEHLPSWYNQLVKLNMPVAGYDATVLDFLEPIHWDYDLALQPWVAAFGADAVQLRSYGDDLRQGDALYRGFFDAAGLPFPSKAVIPAKDPNPRMDARMVDYTRVVNQRGIRSGARNVLLERAAQALAQQDGAAGSDPRQIAQRFAQITETAHAGLHRLATLPGADLAVDALTAQPLEPQDDAGRRDTAVVALLLSELLMQRSYIQRLTARVTELENAAKDTP